MKIKELRQLIRDLPDDMEVVVTGQDHSYGTVGPGKVRQAEKVDERPYPVYYQYDPRCKPYGEVVNVFWIDDGRY